MTTKSIREAEISFCFPYEASSGDMKMLLKTISKALGATKLTVAGSKPVTDYYINPSTRLRDNNGKLTIDQKSGDKAGIRDEKTSAITREAMDMLRGEARLTVAKERFGITADQSKGTPLGEIGPLDITIDRIHAPMRVTIVDIECQEKDFRFLSEQFEPLQPLRRNKKSAWHYFTRKIGFCGAPSSGKSAMTRKLVNALSIDYDMQAEQITEYARTHIARYGTPKWHVQPSIMAGQRALEQDAKHATVLVTDSPIFLGYIYMKHYIEGALDAEAIHMLSQAYSDALSSAAQYTDLLLLAPREPKADGIRITNTSSIATIHDEIEKFLTDHNIAHASCLCTDSVYSIIENLYNINKVVTETW